MKKVTCVGYHYTGSGVIDDLLKECDNVAQCKVDAECRILQDPDGVSDLEYHLIENPHRLKTSLALERFIRLAKDQRRMYEKVFGKEWIIICKKYIETISAFKYSGYTKRLLLTKSLWYKPLFLFFRIIHKLTPKPYKKPEGYNYFPWVCQYYSHPSEEEFLCKTRFFIESLCSCIPEANEKEFVVLNQLVPGDNPDRYIRYVNDLKVIIVDRDPRDLFIFLSLRKDSLYPQNVKQFCDIYRNIRCNYDKSSKNRDVLYMKFEDLIYKYDEMKNRVFEFVGIDPVHHVSPKKYFDPQISINGTKLWEKYPQYKSDVEVIESLLPGYIYNY